MVKINAKPRVPTVEGPQGPQGIPGPQGPKGDTGSTPDTSLFVTHPELGNLVMPRKVALMEDYSWYKAFRINNSPNGFQAPDEQTNILFSIWLQTDFGTTGTHQTSFIQGSFGVRGGIDGFAHLERLWEATIRPVLISTGNKELGQELGAWQFRVYKEGSEAWLYIRTATYSQGYIEVMGVHAANDWFRMERVQKGNYSTYAPLPVPSNGELLWDSSTATEFQGIRIGNSNVATSADIARLEQRIAALESRP